MVLSDGDQQDSTMAIFASSIQNLMKSNVISKPPLFCKSTTVMTEHIETVEKFAKCVKADTSLEKVMILWDTLPDDTRNEVIFDEEYSSHSEDYAWLCNKLKNMFPVQSNKVFDLISLNQLKQDGRSIQEYVSVVKQAFAKRKINLMDRNCKGMLFKFL